MLNFLDEQVGDGVATGIVCTDTDRESTTRKAGAADGRRHGWYTLDGRRLSGKPSRSGIYLNNGHKVAIK